MLEQCLCLISGFNLDWAHIDTRMMPQNWLQGAFTVLEQCRWPVVAAVHGACIGGGVDLITACDIRVCSQDATFCVKVGGWLGTGERVWVATFGGVGHPAHACGFPLFTSLFLLTTPAFVLLRRKLTWPSQQTWGRCRY